MSDTFIFEGEEYTALDLCRMDDDEFDAFADALNEEEKIEVTRMLDEAESKDEDDDDEKSKKKEPSENLNKVKEAKKKFENAKKILDKNDDFVNGNDVITGSSKKAEESYSIRDKLIASLSEDSKEKQKKQADNAHKDDNSGNENLSNRKFRNEHPVEVEPDREKQGYDDITKGGTKNVKNPSPRGSSDKLNNKDQYKDARPKI